MEQLKALVLSLWVFRVWRKLPSLDSSSPRRLEQISSRPRSEACSCSSLPEHRKIKTLLVQAKLPGGGKDSLLKFGIISIFKCEKTKRGYDKQVRMGQGYSMKL